MQEFASSDSRQPVPGVLTGYGCRGSGPGAWYLKLHRDNDDVDGDDDDDDDEDDDAWNAHRHVSSIEVAPAICIICRVALSDENWCSFRQPRVLCFLLL